MSIEKDIQIIRTLLPGHYFVSESKQKGNVRAASKIGMRKGKDRDDDEAFEKFVEQLKFFFADRFQEVFHNVCSYHSDLTIYLRDELRRNEAATATNAERIF